MKKLTATVGALIALGMGTASAGQLLIPAYFYPHGAPATSGWERLTTAASTAASITAIVNPSNGPGATQDANYAAAIDAFRRAGGRVIGYLHTAYGTRSASALGADIDRYTRFYTLDGFFVDEMSEHLTELDYYRDAYAYIKQLNPSYRVFGNPGTHAPEAYLDVVDTLVVFEGPPTARPTTPFGYDVFGVPTPWMLDHSPDRFGALIYGVSSATEMESLLVQAASRHTGHVFVTDDDLPNPWDTLPAYWQTELAALAVPAPATGWLATLGLGGMAVLARRRKTASPACAGRA